MRSYTKPRDVPNARRRRQLNEDLSAHRPSFGKKKLVSSFVRTPTNPSVDDCKGRLSRCGEQRKKMKESKTPGQLLQHLNTAVSQKLVDASVVGAAMQTCGYNHWWDALAKVRSIQKSLNIQLYPIERNIYITALTRAVSGGAYDVVPERRRQILQLAKDMWYGVESAADSDTFNSGLGAALNVCVVAKEREALSWADELWDWAKSERFQLHDKLYLDYLKVLESFRLHDRVDKLLFELNVKSVDHVFLGAMTNIATKHFDWQRADALWGNIVKRRGVKPICINYSAWAKVHMLCGRPMRAAQIFDDMFSAGLKGDDKVPEDRVQALLIMCHSSPTPLNVGRLQEAVAMGDTLIQTGSSTLIKKNWHRMKSLARRFQSNPTSFKLHDVIVEWKAKTQSLMKDWPNYAAGNNYLDGR